VPEDGVYKDLDNDKSHDLHDPTTPLQIATSLRAISAVAWKEGATRRALDKWAKALR
jgi:hypothetical protein